jgi:hypothetical protein
VAHDPIVELDELLGDRGVELGEMGERAVAQHGDLVKRNRTPR